VLIEYENPNISGHVILVVGSRGSRRRSIAKAILNLKTLVKVVEQRVKGLEEVVEQMEILDKEKIVVIRGQRQAKIVAQLHLERVVELECSLEEKEK
jgi:hypothetical protein